MPDFNMIVEAKDCLTHVEEYRRVGMVPVGRCPACINQSESLPRLAAKAEEDFLIGAGAPRERGVLDEFFNPGPPGRGWVASYPWERH